VQSFRLRRSHRSGHLAREHLGRGASTPPVYVYRHGTSSALPLERRCSTNVPRGTLGRDRHLVAPVRHAPAWRELDERAAMAGVDQHDGSPERGQPAALTRVGRRGSGCIVDSHDKISHRARLCHVHPKCTSRSDSPPQGVRGVLRRSAGVTRGACARRAPTPARRPMSAGCAFHSRHALTASDTRPIRNWTLLSYSGFGGAGGTRTLLSRWHALYRRGRCPNRQRPQDVVGGAGLEPALPAF
jgi:hypothetical protein